MQNSQNLSWKERCDNQGVKTHEISELDLKCKELGLPKGSSLLSLATKIYGVKTQSEAERIIGKDWASKVCD